MANTEGLADEVLPGLLSPNVGSTTGRRKRSAFLERRMNTPMGDRPAATIRRASPRVTTTTTTTTTTTPTTTTTTTTTTMKPLIGSIKERSVAVSSFQQQQSRFSTNRPRQTLAAPPPSTGFPSLTHKPLGTFVKKNKRSQKSSTQPQPTTPPTDIPGRDATAMLEQMSVQEIQDNVQQLQSSLSPDMIAFLRKRGQDKKSTTTTSTVVPKETRTASTVPNTELAELQEKKRLAKALASVKTFQDMDRLYLDETKRVESTIPSTRTLLDEAYRLLRSSSPRQTLWAVRHVCMALEQDVRQGKSFPQHPWPYPILLPVSLRCLLDEPLAHNSGGYQLHSLVLRALSALLQLRIPSRDDLFPQYFLNDATTTPLQSLYKRQSPVAVATNPQGQPMAYSTGSSSTSATSDGQAFRSDPAWTLVSKMKLIPRLAQILTTAELPRNAIVAICGILTAISLRSPGAASAIAQHSTLLPALYRQTVLPLNTNFMDPTTTVAMLQMLQQMARQSRTAVQTIPFDKFGPALLGMKYSSSSANEEKEENEENHNIHRQVLILWRILLRYVLKRERERERKKRVCVYILLPGLSIASVPT